VTFDDTKYFTAALSGESSWVSYFISQKGYPPPCPYSNCDTNGDGIVTFDDIRPFTALIGHNAALSLRYIWDGENRLISVRPVSSPFVGSQWLEFVYDYMGRRVQKKIWTWQSGTWTLTDTRKFVWDGWLMLFELDGGDAIVRKYTWGLDLAGQRGGQSSALSATLEAAGGIGGLVAIQDPNDLNGANDLFGNFAVFYDANGNVGQLVDWSHDPNDPAGAIAAKYEYDPYGNVTASSGTYNAENPIRFSTKYFDAETGLGYWGYRYYSPSIGRWISRDPIGELGAVALYVYGSNEPVRSLDRLGQCVIYGDGTSTCGVGPASKPASGPTSKPWPKGGDGDGKGPDDQPCPPDQSRPPPNPCWDLCTSPEGQKQVGKANGRVLCRTNDPHGLWCACVKTSGYPGGPAGSPNDIKTRCALAHEESHVNYVKSLRNSRTECVDPDGDGVGDVRIVEVFGGLTRETECRAYSAEAKCLEKALRNGECTDNKCRTMVRDALRDALETACNTHGCSYDLSGLYEVLDSDNLSLVNKACGPHEPAPQGWGP
jgi:RHS repeat-associated protein